MTDVVTYEQSLSIAMVSKSRPTASKAQKENKTPPIQECLAYEKCREKKADCSVCLELSVDEWREHVRAILARLDT